MADTTREKPQPLSEKEIRDGYELAGLGSDEDRESFRLLRRLSELTSLSRESVARTHRTASSTGPSEDGDG